MRNCHCILHLRHEDEAWAGYSKHPAKEGQREAWKPGAGGRGWHLLWMRVCIYVFTGRNCAHICSFWVVGKWVFCYIIFFLPFF